ncbi:hypothetical protein SAMN04488511_113158 [Pedobacter suwonensis]|uniref:DUF5808 domain-containing protein n=1 Tax=Pedobacter suwonensis TaxID=332999 RepID=A0A1I0TS02_9SPHI|nr:hypothetical protein [Pedobacter suwonensis]SFA54538.1 hypothetical protein SAMN04488511_113158 [Pedobacter suwonensis]
MKKNIEEENAENWKRRVFYFNKNDHRLIVPKRVKILSWTLNVVHPLSYIIIVLIFTFVFYRFYQHSI